MFLQYFAMGVFGVCDFLTLEAFSLLGLVLRPKQVLRLYNYKFRSQQIHRLLTLSFATRSRFYYSPSNVYIS